jgi:acetate kinase
MAILAVNAGSSSLKFSLYPVVGGRVQDAVLAGNIQGLEPGGQPTMDWKHLGTSHEQRLVPAEGADPDADAFSSALGFLQKMLTSLPGLPALEAVAHRVVHGGREFSASVVVDNGVLDRLLHLNSLAPLHQPHNLAGVRAFKRAFPGVPQVACFDTAFHATLGPLEYTFPLPRGLTAQGVRRYGFHGLSYQFVMGKLKATTPRATQRVLMAHLGNGASLCAAQGGRSVATTMGFSALEGLMMGTRTGSLDSGVLLYLMEQGMDHDQLQKLLYKQSGLLGVSGISADMRRLREDSSDSARFAVDLFTYRVVHDAGALVAGLQGLDLLAFSGGIGEHDTQLRADVCARLGWMGVQIDAAANAAARGDAVAPIHASSSTVEVWVVPTDEGRVAAEEAQALVYPVSS